jgi:hypothetical protein
MTDNIKCKVLSTLYKPFKSILDMVLQKALLDEDLVILEGNLFQQSACCGRKRGYE